jgi:multidrug efflux pump subunit AcrA (membrane-fusion protein)
MTERTRASWVVYVLGALSAGAIAAAILVVGPAAGSARSVSRTATAQSGVVQSTVSGSGNVQAASQLNLGFSTSGTVTRIDVRQGQQVAQGQLIATLDPQSAEVTLEQSKAALQSAEANLAKEEETDGETSTGQSSGGSGAANANAAAAAVSASPGGPASTTTGATSTTAPSSSAPSTTAPAATTAPSRKTAAATPNSSSPGKSTQGGGESGGTETSSSTSKASISTATREANLASARAAVKSDRLTVQSDEQSVQDTKLYAPEDGTIVSLSGQVGETVSGGGTTKSSSAAGSSSASASAAAGAAGGSSARSGSTGAASASGGSGSSSAFAVLSDLNSMQLVVALSESEVGNVKVGQIATVTVEALENSKLAAHVREVAILSTSTSGAVSYDVTFQLDQLDPGLKPGMSATAEVVVKQAEGVNVPTTAISAGAVTVIEHGKQVRRRVVTGLKGNSSTIILSGLKAGEKVALPVATSTSSSSSRGGTGVGRLGGLAGAGGLGGGGFAGAGGGAFFRGGG